MSFMNKGAEETSSEVDRDMQKRNLIALAQSPGGFQFTNTFFPYTSGEIGPYYVQSAGIMANGDAYRRACLDMSSLVVNVLGENFRAEGGVILSGGESRDWIFSGPVASELSSPHTMIYKDGKVIGASMKDKRVAHVADLNNEGSSPRDLWVPAIKREGGNIEHIFFFTDRLEDGVEEMKKLGLKSHALVPLDEYAWEQLQDMGVIDKEVYRSLRERMESKKEWALNTFSSGEGLETLVALFASAKTREKGVKILDTYKEVRGELVDRMKHCAPGVARWLP